MEEFIGKIWHKLITGYASKDHLDAIVTLDDIKPEVAIFFRAMGGDGGLKVEASEATKTDAKRSLAQKIAGTHTTVELAWRDQETLFLPIQIALFDSAKLNRDLYLWLAAMAAEQTWIKSDPRWSVYNQNLIVALLKRFPGLKPRYQRLVQAQIKIRPELANLKKEDAHLEQTIQQALLKPGSVKALPGANQAPQAVYLWLHPQPPNILPPVAPKNTDDNEDDNEGEAKDVEQTRRFKAKHDELPEKDEGMFGIRAETLFTWTEYIKLDRATEEDEDDNAIQIAEDLDHLSIASDTTNKGSRLRFDLDLPASDFDDIRLTKGILLPEWDYKKATMVKDFCCIQPMIARDASDCSLPSHLQASAKKVRSQFEGLVQTRAWISQQNDGTEIDIDAYCNFLADKKTGKEAHSEGLYKQYRPANRDLASLLLADLSLSTDAAANNDQRVIDVIRDSLYLFSEALNNTGDQFSIYGFSSKKRDHVRFHTIKTFSENYNNKIRGRIEAIKPGYYTRMGAAIRHASKLLEKQAASRQILFILTDGKPNDLDHYEGRYGIEDTKMAIIEAKKMGLYPFCITIDKQANEYLPYLFGPRNYVVIKRPDELPTRLPALYAQITV
jgi:nitric oxide reductase NorD protein